MRNMKKHILRIALASALLLHGVTSALAIEEKPDTIVNIGLAPDLLSTVQEALPERSAIDQSFLNPSYDPNISLTMDSQLGVTFIDEGAGYRNSLGYFSFSEGAFDGLTFGGIDSDGSGRVSVDELGVLNGVDVGLVFPNASKVGAGGSLLAGDTAVLGGGTVVEGANGLLMENGEVFQAGSTVGFFLSANAWTGSNVLGWDGEQGDPNVYYSLDFLNPENSADAILGTTDELTRHTAMMFASTDKDHIIVGFEDLDRRYNSDDDFNDAIFTVWSDPAQAISGSDIEIYAAPAPEVGRGLAGLVILGSMLTFGWQRLLWREA
jgi:hypothetical protein